LAEKTVQETLDKNINQEQEDGKEKNQERNPRFNFSYGRREPLGSTPNLFRVIDAWIPVR
jgi:hypothetical protein